MTNSRNSFPTHSNNGNGNTASLNGYNVVVKPNDEDTEDGSLGQLFTILRRRFLLAAGVSIAVTSAIAGWAITTQKPQFEGNFQLLVEPVTGNTRLGDVTKIEEEDKNGLDYDTQILVLQSPEILGPIAQRLKQKYPNSDIEQLPSDLTIKKLKDAKIIDIRYKNRNPDVTRNVLKELADSYLKYSQTQRQTSLRRGIEFVEQQRRQSQQRVDTLQRMLQEFRQRNNFIDPGDKAGQISSQSNSLQAQQQDTQKEINITRKTYANLQGRSGALAALEASPTYQRLFAQIQDIDVKIAAESTRFKDGSPAMDTLQEQRQKVTSLIRQEATRVLGTKLAEVEGQLSLLDARQRSIDTAQSYWDQQQQALPIASRQFTDLQRELKVAEGSLERFLTTLENLQTKAAQQEVPWQLISRPGGALVPVSAVTRNLILGAIAGILLGIAAAMLAERMDATFRSTDDLKERIKLPMLSIIPYLAELEGQAATTQVAQFLETAARRGRRSQSNTLFLESFRTLHVNLQLLGSDSPIRSVVIASAKSEDGRSVVAVNLAQAAAAMGQRVLLVDADFRNPQISDVFEFANDLGLTSLLTSNLDPEEVIQPVRGYSNRLLGDPQEEATSIEENLYILTSGPLHPDPTKILSSKKMQRLMNQFHQEFDLVIYDTPPMLNLADSSLLAPYCDGMVLVVGMSKTERVAVTEALENLKISRSRLLGMVANGSRYQVADSYNFQRTARAQERQMELVETRVGGPHVDDDRDS